MRSKDHGQRSGPVHERSRNIAKRLGDRGVKEEKAEGRERKQEHVKIAEL